MTTVISNRYIFSDNVEKINFVLKKCPTQDMPFFRRHLLFADSTHRPMIPPDGPALPPHPIHYDFRKGTFYETSLKIVSASPELR